MYGELIQKLEFKINMQVLENYLIQSIKDI